MTSEETRLQRALCRMDMPRGQVTLLKYLYENDRFVSTDELAEGIRGGDTHSFISILGPFTNRVDGTDEVVGQPGYGAFIETETRDGQTHYKLRRTARDVIEETPALLDAIENRSMSSLRNAENPVIPREEFDGES